MSTANCALALLARRNGPKEMPCLSDDSSTSLADELRCKVLPFITPFAALGRISKCLRGDVELWGQFCALFNGRSAPTSENGHFRLAFSSHIEYPSVRFHVV